MATPEFNVEWRYEGFSTGDEIGIDSAIDSDGNIIIAGVQGYRSYANDEDDTFTNEYAGDFAAVKLLGTSGAEVWTFTADSLDGEADVFYGVDTDSNNDVILVGWTHGYWTTSNTRTGVRNLAAVKVDGSTGDEIWRYQAVSQVWNREPRLMLYSYLSQKRLVIGSHHGIMMFI